MMHDHSCPGCGIAWACDLGRCMNKIAGYCDICWIIQERKLWAEILVDIKSIMVANV